MRWVPSHQTTQQCLFHAIVMCCFLVWSFVYDEELTSTHLLSNTFSLLVYIFYHLSVCAEDMYITIFFFY